MPITTNWIDPELFLEHQGVRVYHTYKEDDYDQGERHYEFTTDARCGLLDSLCADQPCRHVFDVQALSTWQPPARPPCCCGANDTPETRAAWQRYWELELAALKTAITAAIDRGELSARGWEPPAPVPTPAA